ncbi:MAG: RNA-binding cell elongation regulator Jag/EloR [Desulfobacteraceae bacterium]
MKRTQEFDGKDIESAVQNACAELSLSKSELKYDVISTGATGIFGIVGRKNARIRVKLPDKSGTEKEKAMNDEDYEGIMSIVDEAFGQEAEDTGTKPETGTEKPRKKPAGKNREDSGSSSKSRDSKKTGGKKPESGKTGEQPWKTGEQTDMEPEVQGGDGAPVNEASGQDAQTVDDDREVSALVKDEPEQESFEAFEEIDAEKESERESREVVEVSRELAELAEQAVKRMVSLITEDAAVTSEIDGDKLTLRVDGGNAGILIGRKGQTLEAMQFLADKIVNRKSEARVRVKVDIEGYMETRKANLRQLAFKMAEKAKKTGRPATINQMSGQDRRIIHLTLKDDSKVRTQSKGDGYYRRLVILPKKKGGFNSKKRYHK